MTAPAAGASRRSEVLRSRTGERPARGGGAPGALSNADRKLSALREAANSPVDPDVLKRYGTIRMRRGLAVVSVRNGTCTGCNMNLPPQLFNQLQRGTSLRGCP